MQLSKNFSLSEMIYSDTAKKYQINNNPNTKTIENLKLLCLQVLQPIRDKFGIVIVTSGYRCSDLNKRIGGKANSQHLYGQAADIQVPNSKLQDVFDFVKNNLEYDQLLYEKSKTSRWLHISCKKSGNRKYCDSNYKV